MTNQGGVFVSSEQIYDEVLGMKEGLGRVEGLLEKHIALEGQRNEGVEQRLENHGTRLGDQGTQIVNLDSRLAKSEADILAIQEAQKTRDAEMEKRAAKRMPWWSIPALVLACISVVDMLSDFVRSLTFAP